MFMRIVEGIIPGAACFIAWLLSLFTVTKDYFDEEGEKQGEFVVGT